MSETIKQLLIKTYPNTLCYQTSAGILLSVKYNDSFVLEDVHNTIFANIHDYLVKQNEIVYKLFLYPQSEDDFKCGGVLHTKASDYEDGIYTTYSEIGDCNIRMREIDLEYLMLAGRDKFQGIIVDEDNKGLTNNKFKELNIMGMSFMSPEIEKKDEKYLLKLNDVERARN